MIKKIVLATSNKNKVKEIEYILNGVQILEMPKEIGEIEENGKTFFDNALIKAKQVYQYTKVPTMADDSGLCINSLDGKPGIYSARYGGENLSYNEKITLLLEELKNKKDRTAYFTTAIILILNDEYYIEVEGRINGTIIENPKGSNGFGYDPIFIPDGYNKTFAEMTKEEKNNISHRSIAINKLKEILKYIIEF